MESGPIKEHPNVLRFLAAAQIYCARVETLEKNDAESLTGLILNLTELYSAAHGLPSLDLPHISTDPEKKFEMTHEEWRAHFNRLGNAFDECGYYWSNYDPLEEPNPNEVTECGNLGDDLADIYRDVMPGLRAWPDANADAVAEIVFTWRFLMFSHWGAHVLSALRPLHEMLVKIS